MYLRVDLSQLPVRTTLEEADDFTSFKVVLAVAQHTWVPLEHLTTLAGEAADESWRVSLEQMLTYARAHGWVDPEGRVRAHVEQVAPH